MTRRRSRRDAAEERRVRAVQARLLVASRPEDIARVQQILGGDDLMAAYQLLHHNGDVDACCDHLEYQIAKLWRSQYECQAAAAHQRRRRR